MAEKIFLSMAENQALTRYILKSHNKQCSNYIYLSLIHILHPRLLWIISSNSNNPRHRINCNPSMHPEIKIPNSKPCHHLILPLLPNTNGSNIPAGNNITIFNRFSRKSPVPVTIPCCSICLLYTSRCV